MPLESQLSFSREQELLQMAVPLLLTWYERVARPLPWRMTKDPYKIWLSEIMLQQTRISAVLDYYERFLHTLPDISSLAEADDDTLMKLWQGLGYYSRARNLKKAARIMVSEYGGTFPKTYEAIRSLPGIGDYTAGAVGSIAFGLPVPAIDGNVLRVATRLFSDPRDISEEKVKKSYRELFLSVMPAEMSGAFNQAIMELGQCICLPGGTPLCDSCPLQALCTGHRDCCETDFPVKKKAKERRIEQRTIYVITCDGQIALRRRPDTGLLAGLWEFPNTLSADPDPLPDWELTDAELSAPVFAGKHIFSHIEWHMQTVSVRLSSPRLPEGWVWARPKELAEVYALPTAFQCVYNPILDEIDR